MTKKDARQTEEVKVKVKRLTSTSLAVIVVSNQRQNIQYNMSKLRNCYYWK